MNNPLSLGTIRTIDDLGRIVLPRGIRDKLGIHPKDFMEIRTNGQTILLKKYEENLKGNQIELSDKKIGGKTVYVDLDGRLPEISDETKNMLVADELGFYFHDTLHRYRILRMLS